MKQKNARYAVGLQRLDAKKREVKIEKLFDAFHNPIYVSILPQAPLPYRLPHNIEQSSMRYTVGPCWLSILNVAVYTCSSQTP